MSMREVIGWVAWGLVSLYFIAIILSAFHARAGRQTRLEGGIQGIILFIGLIITAAFPISKFHLLWLFPIAYITSSAVWRRSGPTRG